MALISSEVVVGASKERTWEALADFGNVFAWNPLLTETHGLDGSAQGVGASRSCALAMGGSIEEVVTSWVEGGSVGWSVAGMLGPAPRCSMAITGIDAGSATLRFDMDIEGQDGMTAEQLVGAREQMGPLVELLANAFAHYVVTGERMQMQPA